MIRYSESVFERLPRPEFDTAANVFLPCFGAKVGEIIISVFTVYIGWKGLICVVNGPDASGQQPIGWIGLSSLLFMNAGAWTLWRISFSMGGKSGL